jgi:hypothetical protein
VVHLVVLREGPADDRRIGLLGGSGLLRLLLRLLFAGLFRGFGLFGGGEVALILDANTLM